jgi:hypothetical protein
MASEFLPNNAAMDSVAGPAKINQLERRRRAQLRRSLESSVRAPRLFEVSRVIGVVERRKGGCRLRPDHSATFYSRIGAGSASNATTAASTSHAATARIDDKSLDAMPLWNERIMLARPLYPLGSVLRIHWRI